MAITSSATPDRSIARKNESFRKDLGGIAEKGYVVHPGDVTLPLGPDIDPSRLDVRAESIAPHGYSFHSFLAWTSPIRKRTPWLSEGLSQSIRSKTHTASSKRPSRHRQSPNPCMHRRKGRLSM